MAQPGPAFQWQYDQSSQQYYYIDPRTNEYVYQDGTRIPRSASTPRNAASASTYPGQYNVSPQGSSNYAHNPADNTRYAQARDQTAELTRVMGTLRVGDTREYEANGLHIVDAQDPNSYVRSRYATAPVHRITDPVLYNNGFRAHRLLCATGDEQEERLYSQFRVRGHDFFRFGRVLLILWAEPAGEISGSFVTNTEESDRSIIPGRLGERIHSKVRRFVVIREGDMHCSACPIATYGGRGVSKTGVKKSDHAIIYTGRTIPQPRVHEKPSRDEEGMRPIPIRIVADDPATMLDPMSRVDFNKIHTIQHNVKVRSYGLVHPESQAALATQFANVWRSAMDVSQGLSGGSSRATTSSSSSAAPPMTHGRSSVQTGRASRGLVSSSSRQAQPGSIPEEDDDDKDDEDDDQGNEQEDGEDYENAEDDNNGNAGGGSGVPYSSQQRYRTQSAAISIGASIRSTTEQGASSRGPMYNSPRARSVSSARSTSQSGSGAGGQSARAAYRRLIDGGRTREQAYAMLVNGLVQQGRTESEARDEVSAALSSRPPT